MKALSSPVKNLAEEPSIDITDADDTLSTAATGVLSFDNEEDSEQKSFEVNIAESEDALLKAENAIDRNINQPLIEEEMANNTTKQKPPIELTRLLTTESASVTIVGSQRNSNSTDSWQHLTNHSRPGTQALLNNSFKVTESF